MLRNGVMADTVSITDPTGADQPVEEMYRKAVEMPFDQGHDHTSDDDATTEQPDADVDGCDTTPDRTTNVDTGEMRLSVAAQKAEINNIGELSILRIEQLRSENVELKAETQRLRQELARLRERNTTLERTNYSLDEKVSELDASTKQLVELQRTIEYYRAAKKSLGSELRRTQKNLVDSERRFAHTETQLRSICQQRADRITGMIEDVKSLQRAKAELEQQVETLLGYRQRAMSCMHQLTEELKRVRKENREKSRRLSESRAILQSIDQRLAESITEPA